jgi:3-oxoadipate enol-lactonase
MSVSREGRLTRSGAALHYRVDGADEGRPWIVFGNSLLTGLQVWDAQVSALTAGYSILRYDQRGHGQSEVSREPVDFDLLGEDLLALMDDTGIASCTYVGLSMGVPTGLAACSRAPARFEKLVFVDGAAKTASTGKAFWDERIALARDKGIGALADATVDRWFSASTTDDGLRGRMREMIAATPADGFEQCARALKNYDYFEAVTGIECPLLTIAGAEDGVMPDTMNKTFGGVAGRRSAIIPEAGHIPNFERPDAFNKALISFLEETAS